MNHNTNRHPVRRGLAVLLTMGLLIVGLGATPAAADPPAVFTESFTFTFPNPCTGLDTEITIDSVIRVHLHGERHVVHVSRSGSTSDGYVMNNGVATDVGNANNDRLVLNDIWHHADGSGFKVHETAQFDPVTGEVITGDFSIRCIGK